MKRFYTDVTIAEQSEGWQVTLDRRAVRTQDGQPQIVPTKALARMLAAEWARQPDTMEPAAFFARDLADHAIDQIAPDPSTVIRRLMRFAETDTLCYRANPEEALYRRQIAVWEPLLTALESRHAVRFSRISGVMHRPQPEATIAQLTNALRTLDPFAMAALDSLTGLSASLVIGLSALEPQANAAILWDAASLEEDWQVAHWGVDPEAAAVRARRKADFIAAFDFARAAADPMEAPLA